MPHQCVHCSKLYPDAAQELLKGCECGSHFFYYIKKELADRIEKGSGESNLTGIMFVISDSTESKNYITGFGLSGENEKRTYKLLCVNEQPIDMEIYPYVTIGEQQKLLDIYDESDIIFSLENYDSHDLWPDDDEEFLACKQVEDIGV